MQILFTISVISFFVLLWASVAFVRRIRGGHGIESPSSRPQPGFSDYLFSAVKDASASQPTSRQHQAALDDETTSPKRG